MQKIKDILNNGLLLHKILRVTFMVSCLSLAIGMVSGTLFLPADYWGQDDNFSVYEEPIFQLFEDGSKEEITVPGRCQGARGEEITIVTTLPEQISEGTYLCVRSAKQVMHFYINDKLLQEYDTKYTRITGKVDAMVNVFVPLSSADAGKELKIVSRTDTSYSGNVYPMYMGSQVAIWTHFRSLYGIGFLVAVILIILSIFFMITSAALSFVYHREVELIYLASGVLIAGIWEVANSEFRQLFFPNLSVVNDLAFYTLMLLPISFFLYINILQKGRYSFMIVLIGICDVVVFGRCCIEHVLGVEDFTNAVNVIVAMVLISIVAILISIILDVKKKQIEEYKLVAIGLLFACLFGGIQMFTYFQRTNIFNGVFLEIGLMILLICAGAYTLKNILFLEREKQQAFMESEAKGQFLASMSHEIRTPINTVLGLNTMILRESEEPEIKQYALDVQNAGQNLLDLINNVLDFSKIESGKMEIIPVAYDFARLIHDVRNMVEIRAEKKQLHLYVELDESLPLGLYGDDIRVRQILINILNNAVKYTDEGFVKFTITGERIKSTTAAKRDEVLLHFSVMDTGIGIKEEDIHKLFSDFERVEEARNRGVEGTGLGIGITTRLLALMDSKLEVDSEYGVGSVFSFSLRQEVVNDQPIGNLMDHIQKESEKFEYKVQFVAPRAKILVVDDKEMNRKVLKNLLKQTKVQIMEAADGYECIGLTQREAFDLIFLDHMMPGLDGCETLHKMKENPEYRNHGVPVIALTANVYSGAKERFLEEGFDDYLAKPVDADLLEQTICHYLPKELLEKQLIHREEEEKETQKKQVEEVRELPKATLPEVPGVLWPIALQNLRSEELVVETALDLYAHGKQEWEQLLSFYQSFSAITQEEYERNKDKYRADLEAYRIQVHAMKSNAALIGALEASDIAKILEFAARDERIDRIQMDMDILEERWLGLVEGLQVMAPEEEKLPFDASVLLDYMAMLEFSIEDANADALDLMMKQVGSYDLLGEGKHLFAQLEEAVFQLEYDQARKHVMALRTWLEEQ